MSRFSFALLYAVVALLASTAHAQDILIGLDAAPPFSALRPFSETTRITISFKSSAGIPIDAGTASIGLEAPPRGSIFSTDFPFVEGSHLLDVELPIRSGSVRWDYLFPIRGEYRMIVKAVSGQSRGSRSFSITIKEKEQKWLFLGFFTAALFVIGFIAERIFTGSELKFFLLVVFSTCLAVAGNVMAGASPNTGGEIQIRPAPVGELSRLRWLRLQLTANQSSTNLSLKITHLETQKTVFAVANIPVDNEFAFDFQFTDGDEYRVEAVSNQDGTVTRSDRVVSIAAREPPIRASAPSLIFFVAVVAAGLWIGRLSRRGSIR